MNPLNVAAGIPALLEPLIVIGGPLQYVIVAAAVVLAIVAVVPAAEQWRTKALFAMTTLLGSGEALLIWFHYSLYLKCVVVDPSTNQVTGHVAVSMWVEGEKLYVWALTVAVLALLMRRQRDELMQGAMLFVAALAAVADEDVVQLEARDAGIVGR